MINKRRLKFFAPLAMVLIFLFLTACSTPPFRFDESTAFEYPPLPYPPARFAVISDLHVYSEDLGTEAPEFSLYLEKDRKLLKESEALLSEAVNLILKEKPDFVLVPGDLTKDGELYNHLLVLDYLKKLDQEGIKVFVVPGNHDISNPHAYSFKAEGAERVETVSPEDFAFLYSDMGYGDALYRDPSSLSYVAEVTEELWLLALDSCLYRQNSRKGRPVTDGALSREQISWILEMLNLAQKGGKAVLAMMHHGTVEHYNSQEKHYGEYLVEDWKEVARLLAFHNVQVVFTGHYHAQDITKIRFEDSGKFLYDVETGSLVTYPCPVRIITLESPWRMKVESNFIEEIEYPLPGNLPFSVYAREYLKTRVYGIASGIMKKLRMKEAEIGILAPQITDAFVAHFTGDEVFTGEEMLETKNLSLAGGIIVAGRKSLVYGLWEDLPPRDNDLVLRLDTGEEE